MTDQPPTVMDRLAMLEGRLAGAEKRQYEVDEWAADAIVILAYALGIKIPTPPNGQRDAEGAYMRLNAPKDILVENCEVIHGPTLRPYGATGPEVEAGWRGQTTSP